MSNKTKNWPKHVNPGPVRTASAPYNFVPLPEKVVSVVNKACDLPDHDKYEQGRHTGYFEVALTTRSPLYIRCPFILDEFLRQEMKSKAEEEKNLPFREQVKNNPHFFYTEDPSKPVVPGSSLRGMLRSLLEIVSYGKLHKVTNKQLLTNNVEAGFLVRENKGYVIKVCQSARIQRDKLVDNFYTGSGPNMVPRWEGKPPVQWARVWVKLTRDGGRVTELSYAHRHKYKEGILVITGNMQNKEKEFVFLLPTQNSEKIEVPEDLIKRFHDDDQITQWQKMAFPKDKPKQDCRDRHGMLRKNPVNPGDPVFFLREKGKLTFLGRAHMFRLPYEKSPLDFIPLELRRPEDIDYAEALFGFVRKEQEIRALQESGILDYEPKQGDKWRAYAGRVFVTDAYLEEGQTGIWWSTDPIVPKILATPKPTAFQHYLVQTDSQKDKLKHYGSKTPDETVIRGHKRYWLQGERKLDDIKEDESKVSDKSTQHTQFRPVKPGVKFRFRIYFENLSERELGALCWILHPPGDPQKEYCHQLGMGKPLGMGAIKLDAHLYLTDRHQRYTTLFKGNSWQTGVSTEGESPTDCSVLESRTKAFEAHILEELGLKQGCNYLREVQRIAILLKMMEWPGYPPVPGLDNRYLEKEGRPNTRYMSIQPNNEFKDRPVLPDPSAFGMLTGTADPCLNIINDKAQNKSVVNKSIATGPSVEKVLSSIRVLRGKGEVSKIPEIVTQIEKMDDIAGRRKSAEELQQWLEKHGLWEKKPHVDASWRKKIVQWLNF